MFKRNWKILTLLLLSWTLLTIFVNHPWLGHHDANGVWLTGASRNLRVYGIAQIGLVPMLNRAPLVISPPEYYVHHPPLIVWLTALAETLFGERALSARMVSIYATLISIAAWWVVARRLLGKRLGAIATVCYALSPMIFYFGRMPNHEPLSLAFALTALALIPPSLLSPLSLRRGAGGKVLSPRPEGGGVGVRVFLLTFLAIWSAWGAGFVLLAVYLALSALQRRRQWLLLSAWVGVAVLSVMLFFIISLQGSLQELINAFLWRTSTTSEISVTFTWLEFVRMSGVHLIADTTLSGVLLALGGALLLWRSSPPQRRWLWLALLLGGLAYNLLFRSASYVHDYYKIYLMPALTISMAYAVAWLWGKRLGRPVLIGMLIVGVFQAGMFVSRWYYPASRATEQALGEIVHAQTQADDTIYTDISFNPPLEYYAFRKFIWDTSLDAVPTGDAPALYLTCAFPANADTLTPDERARACTLTRLRG